VFLAFPSPPVPVHLPVGYPPVAARYIAIVLRKSEQGTRYVPIGEWRIAAIIGTGPVPAPVMGTIPVPMIEENVYPNVGDQIHICSGYRNYRWGSMEFEEGRKANIEVDMHFRHRLFLHPERQEDPDRHCQQQCPVKILAHFSSPLVDQIEGTYQKRIGFQAESICDLAHPASRFPILDQNGGIYVFNSAKACKIFTDFSEIEKVLTKHLVTNDPLSMCRFDDVDKSHTTKKNYTCSGDWETDVCGMGGV